MVGPTVHELEQCRARNQFLEREHSRLMLVVSEQADTIARQAAALAQGQIDMTETGR